MEFHRKLYFVALLAAIPHVVTGKQNCVDLNVGPALNRKKKQTQAFLFAHHVMFVWTTWHISQLFFHFSVIVFKQLSKQLDTVNFHVLIFDTSFL